MAIMAHLDSNREQDKVQAPEELDIFVQAASNDQETLGPNAFVEGLLVHDWEEIQTTHLDNIKSNNIQRIDRVDTRARATRHRAEKE